MNDTKFNSTENLTYEKILIQRASLQQQPISGSLELLPLCNMSCDMCYIKKSKKEVACEGGLRSVEEWIQLGQEMAKAGVLFLLLTGGEPLMFPEFRKLYIELKRLGMILTINTNGTLLNREWADFFAMNKPRRINITLYGTDDRTYEKLCHYPGGFSKTISAIELLRERGIDVKINGSVTKQNYIDMEKIYLIGERMGVPVHMDTYMLPGLHERHLPFAHQARLLPEEAAAAELFMLKREMGSDAFKRYVQQILFQKEKTGIAYSDQITCLAGNCSFAVGWRGDLRPCVTFEAPKVSVFEKGFAASWQEISKEAKKLKLSPECVNCSLRFVCKTCPASAYLETGSYDGVPEYLCHYSKKLLELYSHGY